MRLTSEGPGDARRDRVLLHPFDRFTKLERIGRPQAVSRRRWMAALRALAVRAAPYGGLRAAAAGRFALHPYQLEPALAALAGRTRLLLADEVGLGKTVQAAALLAELRERGQAARVLILAPAGLRGQWASELSHRFSIASFIVDAASLRRAVAQLPPGVNPWTLHEVCIASIDFVKRPEVIGALESIVWDLVVVDEAHQVSARDRGAAARGLGCRSRRLVLLTATPHAGDAGAFQSLCDVGRVDRSDDPLMVFRRSRGDVGLPRRRRIHLLQVRPTPAERRMHHVLAGYTRLVWRESEARGDPAALLAMTVLAKRALSSASSLARSVARRIERLDASPAAPWQPLLPLGDASDADRSDEDEAEAGEASGAPGLEDGARERAWLEAVGAAARAAAAGESKLGALHRLLRRCAEPAIVFTEYRDTAARLATGLSDLTTITLLHGGMTEDERRAAVHRFLSGAARVLLATDAGGQGLNLQAGGRLVVNFELPWNPARLEQRVGRVDRLGQTRPVHALHLVQRATAEARILARLFLRLERARAAVGSVDAILGRLPADAIARAMVTADGRALRWAPTGPPARPLHAAPAAFRIRARAEGRRLELVRRLLAADARSGGSSPPKRRAPLALARRRPWIACLRADRLRAPLTGGRGFLLILRATIRDAARSLLEELLIPVHLPARTPRGASRADARRLAACLTPASGRPPPGAEAAVRRRLLIVRARHRSALARLARRGRALRRAPAASLAEALIQPGLFDARALRRAARTREADGAVRSALEARLAALEAGREVTLAEAPEVMLVGILV